VSPGPGSRQSWLKNRARNSLPLCAADRVLGTALAVGRHQRKHLIGHIYNLLVSGVIAPSNLALAVRTSEVRSKYPGSEPTLSCGLLCPCIRARSAARYNDGVRRKAGDEAVDRVSICPPAGADDGDMSQTLPP
jgi:hypothetical protein